MNETEILSEMLGIYKKYVKAVLDMGTITMSPKDEQRLKELEQELGKAKQLRDNCHCGR